ncbi:TPA: DUF4145 domain-containing protein [Serratia marcescens]
MPGPFLFPPFSKDDLPSWLCPNCYRATLKLVPESFKIGRTPRAHKSHSVEGYWQGNDEFIFSCILKCSQKNCEQPVAVFGVGDYQQQWINGMGGEWEWFDCYIPRSFYPPLPLFTSCEQYPKQIKEQLQELSAQLPGHPQAAINALRTALEMIMDHFDIPRVDKGRYISLDSRINKIPSKYQNLKEGFLAMKWMGNTGSHNLKPVDNVDIDAACYMLDDFLLRIFRPENDHLETIVRLNKNYNPRLKS